MEIKTLKASQRDPHGSRSAKRLRRSGQVPGIVYGHKQDPEAISLDRALVEHELESGAHIVQLDLGGRSETCLIKDVQFDHLGIELQHIDFARVDLNERVRVKVPIELRGHAKGQEKGGVVSQQLMEIEVECLVTAIPSQLRVPIADLDLNQMLHIHEVALPEGVRAVGDPEAIVVMCREPLAAVEAPATTEVAAEGAAEPEVITKGKAAKEGEEEAEEK